MYLWLFTVLAVPSATVWSNPLGKNVFATQNDNEAEFRDKAFDEEFRKVTLVGSAPTLPNINPRKMVSQWNAVAVTTMVLVLMQVQLSHSRPNDSKQAVANRRQDDELTRETQIGESKVYGLIHNESEDKEAIKEKEDLHSKVLTVFDNVQQKFVNLLNPGAIVDKATPKDYEPNPIEDYDALRKGIVNLVDFFAKQINAIIDAPKNILKKANKKFSKSLNDFGAKISGLE